MFMLAGVAIAVIAVIVVVAIVLNSAGDGKPPPVAAPKPSATAAPQKLDPEISSFDPAGDGFREKGQTWDTYTYNTVQFGNLKKGVGLALDLGSAKALDSVTFTTTTGPMDVELRSADKKPLKVSDWDVVDGSSDSASGETTLDASKGGKHRYWMIWVTKLGPPRKAVISDVSAIG
jgi:hypothetical protein